MSTTTLKAKNLSRQSIRRYWGGELLMRGTYSVQEIADIVKVSTSSVLNWKRRLRANGNDLSVLDRRPTPGRPAKLSAEQRKQLKEMIGQGALSFGYETDLWTSAVVADLVKRKFNVEMTPRAIRYILKNMGISHQNVIVHRLYADDVPVTV